MPTRRLFLETALLPTGWADNVALDVESGWITAVMPDALPHGRERMGGIALPGLPNLHSHTFQRAMAGLAEMRGPTDDSFWTWREVMYRFLERLTPDDVEAIAAFAMMEMIESGFTALAEFHYLHHDPAGRPYANHAELCERIAAAAAQTGIGLTLLPSLYTHGSFGNAPPTAGQLRFLNDLAAFENLLPHAQAALAPLDDAVLGIAPHSLRAIPAGCLRALPALTPGPIHVHAAEQTREVEDCLAWSGQRPVAYLLAHAEVDRRWCLIHATHIDAAETKSLAATNAVAGLCPITEASLGDGIFPAQAFLAAHGRFGVGTDSNIEITAPGELKSLEYAQRLTHRARNVLAAGPGASTGRSLYEAALSGGAQALGRRIGRLEPGHRADLVLLDRTHPDLAHLTADRYLDAYLFTPARTAIDTVLIAGQTLATEGRHHAHEPIARRYQSTLRRLASS